MKAFAWGALAAVALSGVANAETKVWLDELDLTKMTCDWQRPQANRSVEGRGLKVADQAFARGVGTHALSSLTAKVGGKTLGFEADVGLDAETASSSAGSVIFFVYADGKVVAKSPLMKAGTKPHHLKADLRGAKEVELFVCHANDGNNFDHADWCNAFFTLEDGGKVEPFLVPPKQLGILTPKAGPAPKINGPKVYGVRPGHPVIYRLPVSGERPMTYSVENLPEGLKFDAKTGILTGSVAKRGDYALRFTAKNAKGSATRTFTVKVGDRIALTPPMGWNSWNCFAHAVTAKNIYDTADVFDRSELANHGWSYVNIDDYWQNKVVKTDDKTLIGPARNPDGTIAVNSRFPSMKDLADYVHSKGFRIGLYSSPGPWTCGRCAGSWKHEWQDAKTYAEWGFDYLKYDWCGYSSVTKSVAVGQAALELPYRLMGEALRAQNRDIVFSLCQYGMGNVSTWGETTGGNCWRTTGDIYDSWHSMTSILDRQADLWPFAHPGAWNDPDMLIVGRLGWGKLHPTRLTPNEQYTHMSMWCVVCSPLLLGCDLTQLDDFTLSLLTNDEVLETSQDELGAAAARVYQTGNAELWAKPMSDGSLVFALVNMSSRDQAITVDFASLGLEGEWLVRDLWRQKDLGLYVKSFSDTVPPHATTLVRFFPKAGGRLREGMTDVRMNSVYYRFDRVRPVDMPGYVSPKAAAEPCADCPRGRR